MKARLTEYDDDDTPKSCPIEYLTDTDLLRDQTAIVVNGHRGLGYELAKLFHKLGAHVVIACKTKEKGCNAMRLLCQNYTANVSKQDMPPLQYIPLDLSRLTSVREFAQRIQLSNMKCNYLVLNEGKFYTHRGVTTDGFEEFFQTNFLSMFLLADLMLDTLARDKARVLTIASSLHKLAPKIKEFNLDDLRSDMKHTKYKVWDLYAHSKLCCVMFAHELQRRFEGTDALSFSVDPGYVQRCVDGIGQESSSLLSALVKPVEKIFAKKPQDGALTVLYCAIMPRDLLVPGGHYIDHNGKTIPCSRLKKVATDKILARELWNVSSELCGRGSSSC